VNYSNPNPPDAPRVALDRILNSAVMNMTGPEAIATAKKILKEAAEESFFSFFKQCWRLIEREKFTPGWHIEAMAEHCEAVYHRQITKLLINIPPRSSKSILVSVAFPAWVWIKDPSERFLCLSYAEKLAEEHSRTCRDIIQSSWYQENWGDLYTLRGDKNTKLTYVNSETGRRISASMDGVATGFGGSFVILDDPNNLKEIHSKARREAVNRVYKQAIRSRENQPGKTRWIAVAQRGHEADLSATLLSEGDWEHLMIQQEFDPMRRVYTCIGWTDPRTERGELMCPKRFTREKLDLEKSGDGMGSYNYAAQHQQDPRPSSGGCFERQNFRWYTTRNEGFWCKDVALLCGLDEPVYVESVWTGVPAGLKHPFEALVTSWDLAVKGNPTSSWSVGGCWGRTARKHHLGLGYFLWDMVRKRVEYGGQKEMFAAMAEKHPAANLHYVEDKALGPALVSEMKSSFSGIVAVDPRVHGSKEQRARAVSPLVNDGRLVWLPHPNEAPWVRAVLDEVSSFPLSASNDIVDMMSQVLMKLRLAAGPSSFRTSAPLPPPPSDEDEQDNKGKQESTENTESKPVRVRQLTQAQRIRQRMSQKNGRRR